MVWVGYWTVYNGESIERFAVKASHLPLPSLLGFPASLIVIY